MSNLLSKAILAVAAGSMLLGAVACSKNDDDKDLKLSKNSVEVVVAKTETITVKNGTSPYTVKSSDEKVATATVSKADITITGVAEGKATLTVTDKDKTTAVVVVTVKKAAEEKK